MSKEPLYAHSANQAGHWHRLSDHLSSVGAMAERFAGKASWSGEARLAGQLHDLGKYGLRFQARLKGQDQGLDHWSQGAVLALRSFHSVAAALVIEGHHIGLRYLAGEHLRKLDLAKLSQNHPQRLELSETELTALEACLQADDIAPESPIATALGNDLTSRIDRMLDIRMLFSTLVDADFLDTEAHFEGDETGKRYRPAGPQLQPTEALTVLLERIEALKSATQADSRIASVRQNLLADALHSADLDPGLFTLTAPTGSGKTLAMLAFALRHAQRWGLRRIVMVIPYLSIIEQTAQIYRDIFEPIFGSDYVLEHHSLAGGGAEHHRSDDEGSRGDEPERRRRLLAENWDAPLIVTTSVQALESLFSNRPSACRKLHRLAGSVILFDEVQTLPANLAAPSLAALSHLATDYGSSIVFSTATQPAFTHLHENVKQQCRDGWQPREIVAEPSRLFAPVRRVKVDWGDPDQVLQWDTLAERLDQEPQALCILNLKRHAQMLWERLAAGDALHLSTNLCPAHRREVLATVRARLQRREAVRLIATQCIEAGVDVDFPAVWRAYAPLDAIIQAAGRCNREGTLLDLGRLHVFLPEDEQYPPGGGYEQAAQVTKMLLKRHGAAKMNLDDPAFITAYFQELYGIAAIDRHPKAQALLKWVDAGAFPEIAREYRLIDQDTIQIVVPYAPCFDQFEHLCKEAERSGLTRQWIRDARALTVGWHRPKSDDDPIWDSLIPVQQFRKRGRDVREDWFIYSISEHYHPALGLLPPGTLNVWIA